MPEKVLIIEEKQVLGRKLTAALTRAGFLVACVPNQPVLAFALDEFNPDMIIVDRVLLEGDGTQGYAELLDNFQVPVFLLGRGPDNWLCMLATRGTGFQRRELSYLELAERLRSALRQHEEKKA